MIKPSLAFMLLFALAGCPAGTNVGATLKTLGVNELDCGKSAVANEIPTVTDTVGSLLSLTTPNGQALLDALFRQAPELIACTVQSIVGAVEHPVIGAALRPKLAQNASAITTNGHAALSRWGVK